MRKLNLEGLARKCNDYLLVIDMFPLYSKSVYPSVTIPEVVKNAQKAENVVVSGVVSGCCVLSTVFGLIDLGCRIIFLTDACSGMDSEEENHVMSILNALTYCHITFMTTEEYLCKQLGMIWRMHYEINVF